MNTLTTLNRISRGAILTKKRYSDAQKLLDVAEDNFRATNKLVNELERELGKLEAVYNESGTDGLWSEMISDIHTDLSDYDDVLNELEGKVQDAEDLLSCIDTDVEGAYYEIKNATGNRV